MNTIIWDTNFIIVPIYTPHYLQFNCAGTQSAGLIALKKARDNKYGFKGPMRTALDDLTLTGKLNKGNHPVHTSQIAGPSTKKALKEDDILPVPVTPDRPIGHLDFDDLHPPSPVVRKGGSVKKTKPTQDSVILKYNDSQDSSDLDIRPSGKVSHVRTAAADTTSTESEGICIIIALSDMIHF